MQLPLFQAILFVRALLGCLVAQDHLFDPVRGDECMLNNLAFSICLRCFILA